MEALFYLFLFIIEVWLSIQIDSNRYRSRRKVRQSDSLSD
jgi:hypothetical protein